MVGSSDLGVIIQIYYTSTKLSSNKEDDEIYKQEIEHNEILQIAVSGDKNDRWLMFLIIVLYYLYILYCFLLVFERLMWLR